MGKRYYCDYCDKHMADTPAVVKTHNKGLVHQKLVLDHYQSYKDAGTILAEESTKKPCVRFPRGECLFGSVCRFSHYTQEELNQLREIAGRRPLLNKDGSTVPMENTLDRLLAAADGKDESEKTNIQPSFEELYEKLQQQKTETPPEEEGTTLLCDKSGITHFLPWTYDTNLDGFSEQIPPSIKKLKVEDFESVSINSWG